MIFTFDNKRFADQPTPDFTTLKSAITDASNLCESLSRDIRNLHKESTFKYLLKFYSDAFASISTKIQAINKLGTTFRNEVYSISRDLTEIIVDSCWIWFFYL